MNMLFKQKDLVPFASSEIRFKEHKIDESDRFIGPGYYESRTFIEDIQSKPSTKATGFNIKDNRFQKTGGFQKDAKNLPGPGHYELGDSEKWHKPSFNIIFED